MSTDTMRLFLAYPWPGNVRELRNALEFAVIRCKGTIIHTGDLPPEFLEIPNPEHTCDGSSQDEKARLLRALEKAEGNRTAAAQLLGVSRATLYRRLAGFAISSGQ